MGRSACLNTRNSEHRPMRLTLSFFFVASLLGVIFSYLGAVHPAGDSFAVIRLPLAGCAVFCALFLGQRTRRLIAGLTALVVIVPWGLGKTDAADGGAYSLYQKNLWMGNADITDVAHDILRSNADFVTLQEVSDRNEAIFPILSADYPYQHFCDFSERSGVAVLSKHPFVDGTQSCSRGHGLASVRVQRAGGQIWLHSVHLSWPWPYGQHRQLERLLPTLSEMEGDHILGGDFNIVPWSHTMRAIARVTGTDPLGPTQPTLWLRGWIPLSIDHVLVPNGGSGLLKSRPRFGSDHQGVLARFDAP